MNALPVDIVSQMLMHLTVAQAASAARVCRVFYEAFESELFWRAVYLRDIGPLPELNSVSSCSFRELYKDACSLKFDEEFTTLTPATAVLDQTATPGPHVKLYTVSNKGHTLHKSFGDGYILCMRTVQTVGRRSQAWGVRIDAYVTGSDADIGVVSHRYKWDAEWLRHHSGNSFYVSQDRFGPNDVVVVVVDWRKSVPVVRIGRRGIAVVYERVLHNPDELLPLVPAVALRHIGYQVTLVPAAVSELDGLPRELNSGKRV